MARFGRFSVELLAVTAALSLVGSGVAAAADSGVVSGSSVAARTAASVAPSAQFSQETSTDSSDPYIPPELSQDPQNMPRAIWGVDDRARITNTASYPYSAVVSISHGDSYWCSGSMVGKDVLLTAAHCVVDAKTGAIVTNMIFRPGANGTNEPFGRATAKKVIIGPEFKRAYGAKYDPHDDWAVVKLSSTIGDKTGYFGVKADMPSGTTLTLTGYPIDKFDTYGLSMWSSSGKVSMAGEYYYSQIDMWNMQSGSPLYDASKYVGAINTFDNSSYSWHQRITPDILTVVRAMKSNTSVLVSSVSVSGSASVKVGEQTVLTANVLPRVAENKGVSWKSSDTSVATVDANGKVTGKKAGTVTITATAKDGSGKAGSLKVTVGLPVTSVNVSGASSVMVGSVVQLKAAVAPSNALNKAVLWKSSDTAVATVDANGKVTGKKAGMVTITATAKDGSGKAGSFKVTVVKTSWKRLWGQNQFDTMSAISKAGFTSTGGTVVIATSAGYQDALAANGIAGVNNAPILFVEPKKLPAQTKAELSRLKPKKIIVAGGQYAVSDNVLKEIEATTGVKPNRYWGQVASDTADALAKAGKGKWGKSAVVVTDASYWDALSVGSYAYAKHVPIFYAQGGKKLSANTLRMMKDLGITQVYIIGGPYAVSTNVDEQIKAKGMSTQRVYGQTMINTSQKVAEFSIKQGMSVNKMGIATTNGYYDGLVASPLLGRNNSVLVLTDSKDLSAIDAVYGKSKKTKIIAQGYIFGGKNAVKDNVYTHVNQ